MQMPKSSATSQIAFQRSSESTLTVEPFHERDFLVAKIDQMLQGQRGSTVVIQNNIGHALDPAMASNGDCR